MIRTCFIMGLLTTLFGSDSANKYEAFWTWFSASESNYVNNEFNEIKEREKLFDELQGRLHSVNNELVFEFGPIGTKRELIISADGLKTAFDDVTKLIKAAPKSDRWQFIAFRQRKIPVLTVQIGDVTIDPDKTNYTLIKNKGKVAIILYHKGLTENNRKTYIQGSYLLLDGALGEFDMETKVGFIEITSPQDPKLGKYFDETNIVSNIAKHFDSAYSKIEN